MNHFWEALCYGMAMADSEVKWAVVLVVAAYLLFDLIRRTKAYQALARRAQ